MGEACRFYGWNMKDVLDMPATQFFVMMEAKQIIESKELVHQCYLSRASNLPVDAFNEMVSFFSSPQKQIDYVDEVEPEPTKFLQGDEAFKAVKDAFLKDTRLNRDITNGRRYH